MAVDDGQFGDKYAVVWEPISQEDAKFKKHLPEQANQLLSIWREGLIENVYLNPTANKTKNEEKTNIVFFVKAKSEEEAHEILARLPFVEHDVVKYTLYPVGILWLKEFKESSSSGN